MWLHRRQPTRLPRPWDSPGKNSGVGCHFLFQCTKGKSESEIAQSCPTLSDPMDCSLSGSSIHGIFQARVLEWSAILQFQISDLNFLRPSFKVKVGPYPASLRADMRIYRPSMPVCVLSRFSRVQLLATPWTVVHQAHLSVGFPRQEYWSGLPFPPLEDLPDLGIKPASLTSSFIGRRILYH